MRIASLRAGHLVPFALVVLTLAVPRAHAQTDVKHYNFDVAATGRFHLDSERGAVDLEVDNGRTVRVEIEREARRGYRLEDFRVTVEQRGGDVYVRGHFTDPDRRERRGDDYRVRYRIVVPRAFDATIRTSIGDVTVADLQGDLDVESAAASLQLGHIGGRVTAATSAGSIRLESAGGDTRIQTSAGGVEVGHVRGDLDVRTSAGSILAEAVDGDFRAYTSAGNIEATLTRAPTRDTRLETSAGNIELRLPQGAGFVV
ncbi:MAG TPA: DUF4097 family beta strand repeat-containing protein, partial [Rhodothermales bacterium]|nr:DUF4097 family beta strand repeat-containing protein [Rhodothermales bacterium]